MAVRSDTWLCLIELNMSLARAGISTQLNHSISLYKAAAWVGLKRCFAKDDCQMRVCQRGWAGRPWARNPKTPHFHWLALGQPGPPTPSLLSTGPGPARPPKVLTFIDRPWASPAHLNPSLVAAGPGQPKPSLRLARPLASISQARRRNRGVTPRATGTATAYFPWFGALPIWHTLI